MDLLQAIILGVVQGLTEFIPISSTAHLVFASRWTGIYGGDPEMVTATMAVIQLGTLVRDHYAALTGKRGMRFSGTDGIRPIWLSDEAWLGWLIILGSIPIGTIGFIFKDFIEGPGTKNLWVISIMLIVIALLLTVAEIVGKQRKDIRHLGIWDAIVQGFCQVLALMPGASRSGSTRPPCWS
jgi:undecaprenyl-diphosphatase